MTEVLRRLILDGTAQAKARANSDPPDPTLGLATGVRIKFTGLETCRYG